MEKITMRNAELDAVLAIVHAVRDCIAIAGEEGIPSGHLYTVVMDKMSLAVYQQIIGILKQTKQVRESNHVLYAEKGQ